MCFSFTSKRKKGWETDRQVAVTSAGKWVCYMRFLVDLRSDPHLWSGVFGNGRKNEDIKFQGPSLPGAASRKSERTDAPPTA